MPLYVLVGVLSITNASIEWVRYHEHMDVGWGAHSVRLVARGKRGSIPPNANLRPIFSLCMPLEILVSTPIG
eukprot:scaffold275247_cov22-Tisochrysis_lutea.AAC.1